MSGYFGVFRVTGCDLTAALGCGVCDSRYCTG